MILVEQPGLTADAKDLQKQLSSVKVSLSKVRVLQRLVKRVVGWITLEQSCVVVLEQIIALNG